MAAFLSVALADPLRAGSDAPACTSMLLPGPSQACEREAVKPSAAEPLQAPTRREPNVAPSETAALPIGGVSEAEVQRFLAQHGKPPLEAVRALLNPTDANIRAMHAAHRRNLVNAAYVAERWAALQREGKAVAPVSARELYTVLPHFLSVQLTLYVLPDCAACTQAVEALQATLETYPSAHGKIVVVAERDAEVLAALQHWQLTVPAQRMSPAQALADGVRQVPLFELRDSRRLTTQRLTTPFTPHDVRTWVLGSRPTELDP